MFFLKKAGFHSRLLATAAMVITFSTLTLGYSGLNIVKRMLSERFDQQIDYMIETLAINAELGILIDEQSLLDGLAKSVLNEKDVVGVEIEDSKGRLLAQQNRNPHAPFLIKEKEVLLSQTETDGDELEIIAGTSSNVRHIGRVRIKYNRKGINEVSRIMAQRFIFLSLGLAVISGLTFFLISRSLVLPVISLAGVANHVSKGDSDVRATPGTIPETRRLALAFNGMLDSIEESRQALLRAQTKLSRQEALAEVGKFSMMIAHEVKNPLAIIKSSLDMLKKDLNIPNDNLLLNYAEEEVVRLDQLIEGFLIFSRPTKPRMISTDLNQLAEQVAMGFQLQYNPEILGLNCSIPKQCCTTLADNDLLYRALSNIIRNACEASGNQGRITIDVKNNPTCWKVCVRDYGKGIAPQDLNKIFDPFYTRKATGTGLGLAFVDQVVKAHGGTLTATNHGEGGALFCMEIPLDRCNEKQKDDTANGTYSHC